MKKEPSVSNFYFLIFCFSFFLGSTFFIKISSLQALTSCDSSSFSPEPLEEKEDLRLLLPPKIYMAPQTKLSLYFDNLILAESEKYKFQLQSPCPFGASKRRRWVFRPTLTDKGDYVLKIGLTDLQGRVLQEGETTLIVTPTEEPLKESYNYLSMGDSLGHHSRFPNELASLLQIPRTSYWTMIGTHFPEGTVVPHEHYAGWSWERFNTLYAPGEAKKYHAEKSPFVFLNEEGVPALNISRYIEESLGGKAPDFMTILLGINDVWGMTPHCMKTLEAGIDHMLNQAEIFLKAFKKASSQTKFGIGVIIPGNYSDYSFQISHPDVVTRWEWKQIQYRVSQRMLDFFKNREKEGIYLIPTHLTLDPIDGFAVHDFDYGDTNYTITPAIHPNQQGDKQIALTLYGWLQWMARQKEAPFKE
jgi:lysophospholipase L1-like esterase